MTAIVTLLLGGYGSYGKVMTSQKSSGGCQDDRTIMTPTIGMADYRL